MKLFNILAVLITLSAVFSYINYRFIKLPTTIGVMVISLLGSLGIAVLGFLGFGFEEDGLRDVVDKRDKVLRDVRQASLCELRPDRSNYKFQGLRDGQIVRSSLNNSITNLPSP